MPRTGPISDVLLLGVKGHREKRKIMLADIAFGLRVAVCMDTLLHDFNYHLAGVARKSDERTYPAGVRGKR